jgi:hypothetical protein
MPNYKRNLGFKFNTEENTLDIFWAADNLRLPIYPDQFKEMLEAVKKEKPEWLESE